MALLYWQWQMRVSRRRTEPWMWIVAVASVVGGTLLFLSDRL